MATFSTLPIITGVPSHSPQLYDWLKKRLVDSSLSSYGAARTFIMVSPTLNLLAAAGSSTAATPAGLGGVKGKVAGANLTATANDIYGVAGQYSVTGTKGTTFATAAVMGLVGNGVTALDGAFMAVIAAGASVTTIQAAYGVKSNNSNVSSGFQYGLDLYGPAHDALQAVSFSKGLIRSPNQVCWLEGSGAPTNGGAGTGATFAEKGSLYIDYTNGILYQNTNTKASPTWTAFTGGSALLLAGGTVTGATTFSGALTTSGSKISPKVTMTLVNGANTDFALPAGSYYEVAGPSGSFSVNGFTGGADGREIMINNQIAQQFTITNNATSTAANRILTNTGADVVLAGVGVVRFVYSAAASRWILVSKQGT